MAQDQSVLNLPGVTVERSASDRSLPIRWALGIWSFIVTRPIGAFGLFLIAITIAAAIFAPFVSRYDPDRVFMSTNPEFRPDLYEQSLDNPLMRSTPPYSQNPQWFQEGEVPNQLASPSSEHWLGTDKYAYDMWARIIYGARLSLLVGIGGAVIAVFFGTVLGVVSGYFGGWVDMVIQRFSDTMYTFPPLILLLLFIQVIDRPNKYHITFALGLVGIAQVVRIVRASVLSAREDVYVSAARTIGASDGRIMARHIFPNITAPIIVVFTISIGLYILAEAGLAFIGLGDPTAISWGKMVNEGRGFGSSEPYMALFSGLAITWTVLGFNLFGDALRDALDPRLRGRGSKTGF
jgi:ABC-type dipeptide/oligopeptide/nickel transport system permease subunit